MHGFGNKKNKYKKTGMMTLKAVLIMMKWKEKNYMKLKDQMLWEIK